MQGFLFFEFKQYIQKKLGLNIWEDILKKAGLGPKMYISLLGYPDEEFNAIIFAASELTGKSVPYILEDFGMYMMPGYIRIASHKIDPKWNVLDLLENVPVVFRHILVSAFTGSLPPLMKFVRNKPDEVTIYYTSPRKLCILGRGIIRGFAKYCNNEVKVTELSCMLKGDPQCQIIVKLLPTAPSGILKKETPLVKVGPQSTSTKPENTPSLGPTITPSANPWTIPPDQKK